MVVGTEPETKEEHREILVDSFIEEANKLSEMFNDPNFLISTIMLLCASIATYKGFHKKPVICF